MTSAYTFAQLQHRWFRITGAGHTEAYDFNDNGLYEVLWIMLPIDVDFEATYLYSASLYDNQGREVEFKWWRD